jgi:prepilin-type N-terminal cleavage/methylation domain-containing protein
MELGLSSDVSGRGGLRRPVDAISGTFQPAPPFRPGGRPWAKVTSAFTLVEVLVSLCLLAILLTALNLMVFSMAEVWGHGQQERVFAGHTRAVTRHLQEMLGSAVQSASASGSGTTALQPVKLELPNGGGEAVLLSFTLPAGDRLIHWNGEPLPDVVCSLAASPGHGLMLYWQSRVAIDYGKEPPQGMVLSPYGQSLAYDYYDEVLKAWKTTDDIQTDSSQQPLTPGRLRLRFVRDKQTIETVINLPVAVEGLPPG